MIGLGLGACSPSTPPSAPVNQSYVQPSSAPAAPPASGQPVNPPVPGSPPKDQRSIQEHRGMGSGGPVNPGTHSSSDGERG